MKGCTQGLAGFLAVIFVVTAVFALFTVNLVQAFTDRENVKAALDIEEIFREVAPALIVSSIQENNTLNLPIEIDVETVEATFDDLLPPNWLNTQANLIVDEAFDFLETGDLASSSSVTLDMQPLLLRFREEPGKELVGAILYSLPPCPDPQPTVDLATGRIDSPNCMPTIVPGAQVIDVVHTVVGESLDANPQLLASAGTVTVPLFSPDRLTQEQQQNLRQFQRTFAFAKNWAWTFWLLPLFCLFFIAVMVVRSLRQWGNWWGWPLVLSGGPSLLIGLVIPALLLAQARLFVPNSTDPVGASVSRLLQSGASNLVNFWLDRVFVQAAVMLVFGLILVIMASFIKPLNKQTDEPYIVERY
jgi:hypothetical protein